MANEPPRMLRVRDLLALGFRRSHIHWAIHEGQLKAVQAGPSRRAPFLIREDWLEVWLEQQAENTVARYSTRR